MLFSSMIFLWVFLPFVLIGNNLIGNISRRENSIRNRNIFLLICSFFFYAWGGIYYLLIMIASIAINFAGGFFCIEGRNGRKRNLIIVIILNLLMLFVFKYFNLLTATIENLMASGPKGIIDALLYTKGTGELGWPSIVLPIGISFFTFQSMSYVIDVYMGKAGLQRNIRDFALYVSFFPQLVAGPIVKYSDIEKQLADRKQTTAMVLDGQRRFIYGLSKKVIIANSFGAVADQIWKLQTDKLGAGVAWFGMIAYTIQIYYDFSGYSDMAIGIGKMLGFKFRENFNYPYLAGSVQDFWRRWHISLSSWFKEYVYIPLGGSRCSLFKTCRNTFIVFLLTGFWHGANFTFIAWGLIYAFFLILERCFLGKVLEKNPVKLINHIYTLLIVMIAWVFFRSDNISQAVTYIGRLFSTGGSYSILSYLSMEILLYIEIAILFSGVVQKLLAENIKSLREKAGFMWLEFAVTMLLLVICILKLAGGTYNAFIYFQF